MHIFKKNFEKYIKYKSFIEKNIKIMKIYVLGIVFYFSILVNCQSDLDCHDKCEQKGGTFAEIGKCYGECLNSKCIAKTATRNENEKCGCHADCVESNCENGICCIGRGHCTSNLNFCCSKEGDGGTLGKCKGYSYVCH